MTLTGPTDTAAFWNRLAAAHGHLMFDVGANGGETARMFAKNFDYVVAYEPCVESYASLLTLAGGNVTPVNLALTDHAGHVTLREATSAIAHGQLVSGEKDRPEWGKVIGYREVRCSTVDSEVAQYGVPDAVKIDTEGHEVEVLIGARELLHRPDAPTLYIEVHDRENLTRILHALPETYEVEIIRHEYYPQFSDDWQDHFYMVGNPV